jgi:hypothetical protein
MAAATSEPIRMPTVRPLVRLAQAKPTRPGAACSATNTHAPGTSPPTATPCITRSNNSSTGANKPICAYTGNSPMASVGTAIRNTLRVNIRLRPSVSP